MIYGLRHFVLFRLYTVPPTNYFHHILVSPRIFQIYFLFLIPPRNKNFISTISAILLSRVRDDDFYPSLCWLLRKVKIRFVLLMAPRNQAYFSACSVRIYTQRVFYSFPRRASCERKLKNFIPLSKFADTFILILSRYGQLCIPNE